MVAAAGFACSELDAMRGLLSEADWTKLAVPVGVLLNLSRFKRLLARESDEAMVGGGVAMLAKAAGRLAAD